MREVGVRWESGRARGWSSRSPTGRWRRRPTFSIAACSQPTGLPPRLEELSNRELYYPSRDLADFLSLRAAVWGSDHPHSSVAFQQWLYADAHPEAPRGILVRQRDGLPVGFAGLCVKRLWVDGVDTKLAYGLEYMILPHLGGLMSGRIALRV